MKKIILGTVFVLVGLLSVRSVYAAGEKFFYEAVYYPGVLTAQYDVINSSGAFIATSLQAPINGSPFANDLAARTAIVNGIVSHAISQGYTGATAADVIIPYMPSLATIANTGSYTDLQGLASDMMMLLSQPNVAAVKTAMFGGTTVQYVRGDGSLATTPLASTCYEGTTARTNCLSVFKNATVASGVAVFHLTADGTSGGTALFPNGIIQDSIDVEVNDAAASYQMSYALSNGNKTVTVTANRMTTANILTGILGQAQANGAVVRLVARGY